MLRCARFHRSVSTQGPVECEPGERAPVRYQLPDGEREGHGGGAAATGGASRDQEGEFHLHGETLNFLRGGELALSVFFGGRGNQNTATSFAVTLLLVAKWSQSNS